MNLYMLFAYIVNQISFKVNHVPVKDEIYTFPLMFLFLIIRNVMKFIAI